MERVCGRIGMRPVVLDKILLLAVYLAVPWGMARVYMMSEGESYRERWRTEGSPVNVVDSLGSFGCSRYVGD